MEDRPLITHEPAPIGTVVTGGMSKSEVEALIDNKLNAIPHGGVSEEQVRTIVSAAIKQIPPASGGLTEAQVNTIVQKYIAALPKTNGVTEQRVSQLIAAEIAKLPKTPAGAVTSEQVTAAINTAISKLAIPTIADNGDGTVTISVGE